MYYTLYVNNEGWKKIPTKGRTEEAIINALIEDNNTYKHTYYMIKKTTDRDETLTLRSQEEILDYLQAYKERKRLEQLSILELKEYVIQKRLGR